MDSYKAIPLSRKNIRKIARLIRESIGISDKEAFPVIAFLSYRKLQKSSGKKMFVTRFKKHILKKHIKNWKYMYIT